MLPNWETAFKRAIALHRTKFSFEMSDRGRRQLTPLVSPQVVGKTMPYITSEHKPSAHIAERLEMLRTSTSTL